jgi:integrase
VKTRELEKTKHPGIYRRGNRYVVIFRDGTGRQRKQAAETVSQARAIQAEHRLDPGGDTAVSRERFRDYARRWVDNCAGRTRNGLRQHTRDAYRAHLERDPIPVIGNVRMCDLRPSHLDRLAEKVAKRKGAKGAETVSPYTVRMALAPVKALLADATQKGDIRRNPTTGWKTRWTQAVDEIVDDDETVVEEKVKALDEEQLTALLAEVLPRNDRAAEDEVRSPHYPPDRQHGPGPVDAAGRPRRAHVHLERRGADQPAEPTASRAGAGRQGCRSRRWQGRAVGDVPCVPPYLRERAVRGGWNAKQVQAWLGHHSPAFTLSVYVHLLADGLPDPSFLDTLEGGNRGATQPPETHRDGHPAEAPVLAQNLGRVLAL